MRIRHTLGALTAAALLTLTACEGTADTSSSKPDTTAEETSGQTKQDTTAETDTDAPATEPSVDEAEPETSEVPDVVGMNHREAMGVLHEAGFMVNEEDASPEGRMIILNSGWKVCRQDPAPGATDAIRVAIYSVKQDESC
jgi:PBP1b-binding outer membrane lipoprotein LpoB